MINNPISSCCVSGCGRLAVRSNGMCDRHYRKTLRETDLRTHILNESLFDKFHRNVFPVPESGCWLWINHVRSSGYGTIQVNGISKSVHRVSYELKYGPIQPGMYVCHKCDIPNCVRPEHLFLATAKENSLDMMRKGRHPYFNRTKPKLTISDVERIKFGNEASIQLSRDLRVSVRTISGIRKGVLYARIKKSNNGILEQR